MPPRLNSRHMSSVLVQDSTQEGRTFLTDRVKFLFRDVPTNIPHTVVQGDTFHRLAARYYGALTDLPVFSAAQLWWVIADYQPTPVYDPTIVLVPGTVVILPSGIVLQTQILTQDTTSRAPGA